MEGRRMRRSGRGQSNQTVLPLRAARRLSNTISCWYCDFKFSMLNEALFLFGRRYSRYFRSWFSMGVGFSLAALLGVTLILLWEMGKLLHLYNGETQFVTLLSGSLFGGLSGLTISLADIGYLCISTIVSVSVHELGHALAAASEGIQMEYIAVFLAVLFPGALVAFNDEILQALPKSAALRIYCAGIWHNAGLCAVCAISLFILPLIFYPVYIHGEGPMVLYVASTSPLSRYLSPNDVIHSVDGIRINTVQEWLQIATSLTMQEYQGNYSAFKTSSGTGYCVPYSLLEKRIHVQLRGNETTCPNDLIAFVATSCPELRLSGDWRMENMYCLYAKDILKLEKCGDGWAKTSDNRSSCLCSQVYFLDGESILELMLQYLRFLSPRKRRVALKCCLLGGTFISTLIIFWIFTSF